MLTIREIKVEDAEDYLNLYKKLNEETEFRLYEPAEYNIGLEQQKKIIQEIINNKRSTLLVADLDGALVGYLLAEGREINRIRHRVHISMAVLQAYIRRGIGTKLLAALEDWAYQNHIHRLELTVMENNPAGQELYKKMGYQVEGIKKDSLLINGRYIDDIYMAKLI
ncbi:MAG: GNAT family N-acetyltransferase [Spirochaetota bacterium]